MRFLLEAVFFGTVRVAFKCVYSSYLEIVTALQSVNVLRPGSFGPGIMRKAPPDPAIVIVSSESNV